MHVWLLLSAAVTVAPAAAETPATSGYRKLTSAQIRAKFSGRQFTDGVHFSYRYAPDGAIDGVTMGRKIAKTWTAGKDGLCVTDSFGENCYAVWMKGSAVKLFIGADAFMEGFLK